MNKLIDETVNIINADIDANGYYINIDNKPTIIINKNLNGTSERLTIVEEYAHYHVGAIPTLPFATDYYNKLIRSKNEFKAFKLMQDILLPPDIENSKYDTIWDISDRLELPVEFIEKAIEYRKENLCG